VQQGKEFQASDTTTTAIDSISAAPEPSTWAMLLIASVASASWSIGEVEAALMTA
jgi:hypothetical protein